MLYLLAGRGDVATISGAENIVNQDFTFAPITADALGTRLEVLMLLGARRRLALESAITDRLTGLFNRKYFLRRLEEEMYRALRYGYKVGCILADVDFTAVSGELSEDAGSEAVRAIGDFLTGPPAAYRRAGALPLQRVRRAAARHPGGGQPRRRARPEAEDRGAADQRRRGAESALRAAVGHLLFPADGVKTALDAVDALEDKCLRAKQSNQVE